MGGWGEGGREPEGTEEKMNGRAATRTLLAAWGVHLLTATGLVLAGAVALLIVEGSERAFRMAFGLMAAATLLDAVDGPMARRIGVGRVLPQVDGRKLDDIVDFHTYTSLPLLLLWRSGVVSGGWTWVLAAPLLASAYAFVRVGAKTDDGAFLGFPSYWNVVALYLHFLRPSPFVAAAVLLVLSALTVLPWRYIKPGGRNRVERITLLLALAWGAVVIAVLAGAVDQVAWLLASLAFPVWYMAASWGLEIGRRQAGRAP
jgi:phosphatidylcholine synthase